jgi:hypothetical protein
MTEGQLQHLHDLAIKFQEESLDTDVWTIRHTYASMSIAASNLVLIELAARQMEKVL